MLQVIMETTVIKYVALLIAFVSTLGYADEHLVFRAGGGTRTSVGSALYSVGYESAVIEFLPYRVDIGGWTDIVDGNRSSPFASVVIGPQVGRSDQLNWKLQAGVLILGYPDALLGGVLEFTQETSVHYSSIGVGYRHVSNAGLFPPSVGRNYIFLDFVVPLNY